MSLAHRGRGRPGPLRVLAIAASLAGCARPREGAPPPPPAPAPGPPAAQAALIVEGQPLLGPGARWRYLDDGSDPGPTWMRPDFDDRAWKLGAAPLGYGLGNEATVVGFGPDPASKHVTTYFRAAFSLDDAPEVERLLLEVVHHDGAAVYLDGVEIYRRNLPAGPLTSATRSDARDNAARAHEGSIDPAVLRAVLRDGRNLVAAEVHRYDSASPELSFDLSLTANAPVELTRGPYLQVGAPGEATLRFRTNLPARSRVTWGAQGAGGQMRLLDGPEPTTEHVVRLTDLQPATRYDYTVGTRAGPIAGGDGDHYFVTPPLSGTAKPTRIWVTGDSGTADEDAARVYQAYRTFTGRRHTDLWLMLGDNAYLSGTDEQYQAAVFDFYPELLRQVFLWTTIGNHETYYGGPPESSPYLDIFTLPTRGEAGGLASGSELYYAFDHGNVHFVALDSMVSSRAPGAPMWTWLEADLAANQRPWLIAFFHHPPYSKGSHDSDNADGMDPELVDMRERALPILESYGVDLVLSGHSHSYERSYLLSRHYGPSSTLDGAMKRDHGDGKTDGTGAYHKTASAQGNSEGTVYVVAGSAGLTTPAMGSHPAMLVSLIELGSLVIDLDGDRLQATFLRDDGTAEDRFTIEKSAAAPAAAPAAPVGLSAVTGPDGIAVLRWSHDGADEAGFVVERSAGEDQPFIIVAELGANASTFSDGVVPMRESYRYQVRAANAAGISAPSNVADLELGAPDAAVEGVSGDGGPEDGATDARSGEGDLRCGFVPGAPGGGAGASLVAALLGSAIAGGRRRRREAPRSAGREQRRWRRGGGALPAALLLIAVAASLAGGRLARGHGSEQERLAAAQAEIAAHPRRGASYRQRGELQHQLGHLREALADFERAAQVEPGLPAVDRLAARVLADLGRGAEARARLDRALIADPGDTQALRLRARLSAEAGDQTAAARDLGRLIELRGQAATPEDHLLFARGLRAARRPAAAARALEQARARFGLLVVLELEAIDLAVERRRFDEALARVDAFAATQARKEPWLFRRGAILVAAGRPAAARAAYQQTLAAIARLPPHVRGTRALLALAERTRLALAILFGAGAAKVPLANRAR